MKPTVVILLSDKRSGSTIFQEEICRHAGVNQVDFSPHAYLETQHWLKAARLLEMPKELFYGHKYYGAFTSAKNARAFLIECVQKNVPDFLVPDDDEELILKGWEALCDKFATPVFFEKSPHHLAQWACLSLLLNWMKRTNFRVKVVGLVRNPLAVMYSSEKLFKTNPEQRQFGWSDMYRNLMAFEQFLSPDNYLQVRYEDLITTPQESFRTIYDFIGLDDATPVAESQVHANSRQKWRDDPNFTLQLDESVKQVARYFRYTDEELNNPSLPNAVATQASASNRRLSLKTIRQRFIERTVKPLLLRLRQGR